jgi:acyl-CoA synthetase (AMP-forming)/AMP-acid ligase II
MPLEPARESILLNSIANQLDKYEKPREIYYLEHFEMTDSGKIQRGKCIEKLGLER